MRKLEQITIQNFKSIRDQTLKLAPLNVFIGANGSGKSNLVGIFHFLRGVVERELQIQTAKAGGADALLHFGRKNSQFLKLEVRFVEGSVANGYSLELIPTEEDRFAFGDEKFWYHRTLQYPEPYDIPLGSGHVESRLSRETGNISSYVRQDMRSYQIYHFHDTSDSAKSKSTGDVDDNLFLRPDAANLAAFLYRLKQMNPGHFENIETTIRQIAPFFEGFRLEPSRLNPDKIRLEWREHGNEEYFNASALSDGTLRFICLATLLLQPYIPPLILLDEPELGLHPAAIGLLADLLQSAATTTQVIVATQSVTLVSQFAPEQVWVVERREGASVFEHLEAKDMSNWLEDYSLGELWEKNILGGRP
jgi:predicted ATPase